MFGAENYVTVSAFAHSSTFPPWGLGCLGSRPAEIMQLCGLEKQIRKSHFTSELLGNSSLVAATLQPWPCPSYPDLCRLVGWSGLLMELSGLFCPLLGHCGTLTGSATPVPACPAGTLCSQRSLLTGTSTGRMCL